MKKENIWLITAKTNLHVGNESTSSYGLVDKAIQRDALTDLPCINSSSLKGALNEYATKKVKMEGSDRIRIFGVEKDKTGSDSKTQKGNFIFYDAKILFLPIQEDNCLYKLATSRVVLDDFRRRMATFGIEVSDSNDTLKNELMTCLGIEREIIISDNHSEFSMRCNDLNLPIIARNVLDNGQSQNLWYEQILPSETVFYTLIDDNNDANNGLKSALLGKDAIVQIGANATIGYGYCTFNNFEPKKS